MPVTNLPQHPCRGVKQFSVGSLKPGEAVTVRGRKLDVKGNPTRESYSVTVIMTNRSSQWEGSPFPEITKIRGIAVCSSDQKLLPSAPPRTASWVGREISIGQSWPACTYTARKMLVDEITVIHS